MAHLVLVGTVHRDPEGHDRLLSLFHEEHPDCLTLEVSPYAVRYRRKNRGTLTTRVLDTLHDLDRKTSPRGFQDFLAHPAIRDAIALIDFPFEYMAASVFSQSRKVPFFCIDRSDYSLEKISWIEKELITTENLRTLIDLDPNECSQRTRQEYRLASSALHPRGGVIRRHSPDRWEISQRDRHMEKRIRKILTRLRCHKLMHIGGWEHLLDHGTHETLFDRLSDLQPRRRLLIHGSPFH